MIVGSLAHWPMFRKTLPEALRHAIERTLTLDLDSLAIGRHPIEGDDIFVLIQEMPTRPANDLRPEAHRRYIDIQILLKGREAYGFSSPNPDLQPVEDRLTNHDIAFYPGQASENFVTLAANEFIVFFPGEFHRPCCEVDGSEPIRKAVIKIDARLL
ncbi:YhcH/YjgK/YiaL family protein [Allorhizobium undicola]|uniref:YhcH/YjgK/YiaL family protein n=1 Tax=Allorhizobium undicola TaxID=78527 RepID=UPI00048A2428|nr:YhcH/YjgK/YiaL family protein [Allorhizobium undicola]